MTRGRLVLVGASAVAIGVLVWWVSRTVRREPAARDAPGGQGAISGADTGVWRALEPEPGQKPDPVGTIRLEGQVIDEAEAPVAGATVVLAANPDRIVISEADGSFAIEGLLARVYR